MSRLLSRGLLFSTSASAKNGLVFDPLAVIVFYVIVIFGAFFGNAVPMLTALSLVLIPVLHCQFRGVRWAFLYPLMLFPFQFIVKSIDDSNLVLAIIPDLYVLFAITIYVFHRLLWRGKVAVSNSLKQIGLILFLYLIVTLVVVNLHVGNFDLFLIIVRTYAVPLGFLLSLIFAAQRYPKLCEQGMFLFAISITIVAAISLGQYFGILVLPSASIFVSPYHSVPLQDGNTILTSSRIIIDREYVRLNTLLGGSIGSSSAVLMLFFLLFLRGDIPYFQRNIRFFAAAICLGASVLSLSFSLVAPLFAFLLTLTVVNSRRSTSWGVAVILVLVGAIGYGFVETIDSMSLFSYISWIAKNAVENDSYGEWSLINMMFGIGPAIFSRGYEHLPEGYLVDIGLFRVFEETGILNFSLFLVFLLKVFQSGMYVFGKSNSLSLVFFLPFVTLSVLIHQNFSIGPPFYVLFAVAVAGILTDYERLRKVSTRMRPSRSKVDSQRLYGTVLRPRLQAD